MNKLLKERADKARSLYRSNLITRGEAVEQIEPFIEAYNTKSKEIAKKYDFELESHALVLYGICNNCTKKIR